MKFLRSDDSDKRVSNQKNQAVPVCEQLLKGEHVESAF